MESEDDEEIKKEDIDYEELGKPDYLDDPSFNLNDYLAKRNNLWLSVIIQYLYKPMKYHLFTVLFSLLLIIFSIFILYKHSF